MNPTNATIRLTLRPSPLGILLRVFTRPRIALDGAEQPKGWKAQEFSVTPGAHTVTVVLPYRRAGRNPHTVTVNVVAGQTAVVKYVGPAWDWGIGKLTVAE